MSTSPPAAERGAYASPPRGGLNRRQFLGRSAATALSVGGIGSVVGACGGSDEVGSESGEVVVLSWVSYVTPEIKALFENQFPGITMRGVAAESDADMFTKLSAGGGGQYDIVFANCGWSPTYYKQGLIEPFPPTSVPGRAADEMYSVFIEDPSLPYVTEKGLLLFPNAWGANSLVWNLEVPYQPRGPYSWNALWSDDIPDNRVILAGAGDDFLAIAGLAKGVAPSQAYGMDPAQLRAAEAYLIELKPFQWNKSSDPEFRAAIRSKRAWIGLGTTLGSAPILNEEAGREVAALAIPEEGTVGWIDGPQLVKGAKNRANALKFMQFFATNPDVLKYMFDQYNNAPCNQGFVERVMATGGSAARRMEQVQADKPEVAKSIAFQRAPDDPQAYAAAWDRVQAA
jgi:spermidine/putrescine transport system substrate-binding protein